MSSAPSSAARPILARCAPRLHAALAQLRDVIVAMDSEIPATRPTEEEYQQALAEASAALAEAEGR